MKKFSEQLHKKSLSVKLQAAERRELRERVVSYMEYHPLPTASSPAPSVTRKTTESFVTIPFAYFARFGSAVAVFLLVFIPAMAERAVPGDGLYAVKVRFNEEIRSTLALSPYEKIEWETERLNRRIAEARLLASEGRLTDEVETEVAAAVKTHTENAKREIELLRNEDEEEATLATIALNTTLEVQAASLKDNDDTNNTEEKQPTILAAAVGEVAAKESAIQVGVPGYGKLMARVELNTTRIHELLEALRLSEESEDYKDITRRIGDIDRSVETAIVMRETDENEARLLLVDALQRTQKLIVFMTEVQASQEFDVEDFVPAVLTPEEQSERLATYERETVVLIDALKRKRASSTNANITEKADNTLSQLADLQTSLASSTTSVEMDKLFSEITALATDALELFATQTTTIIPEDTNATSSGEAEVVEEEAAG